MPLPSMRRAGLPSCTVQTFCALVTGCVLGAVATALLDPRCGPRRRRALRRLARATPAGPSVRATGAPSRAARRTGGPARKGAGTEAQQLIERVRACLAYLCEDAGAIEVRVEDGVVELHGPIARREQRRAVRAVRRVPGVGELHTYLQPYDRHGPVVPFGGEGATVH